LCHADLALALSLWLGLRTESLLLSSRWPPAASFDGGPGLTRTPFIVRRRVVVTRYDFEWRFHFGDQ
jgi:hypothetical protein